MMSNVVKGPYQDHIDPLCLPRLYLSHYNTLPPSPHNPHYTTPNYPTPELWVGRCNSHSGIRRLWRRRWLRSWGRLFTIVGLFGIKVTAVASFV